MPCLIQRRPRGHCAIDVDLIAGSVGNLKYMRVHDPGNGIQVARDLLRERDRSRRYLGRKPGYRSARAGRNSTPD